MVNDGQWLTLQEASDVTGRSVNALRMMIKRKKLSRILKTKGKRGDEWVIHQEAVHDLGHADLGQTRVVDQGGQDDLGQSGQTVTIPAELYVQQQKERDQAVQGLIMYRYKFEELDKQLRMLPAPPEVVTSKLQEIEQDRQQKAEALAQAQKILRQAQEVKERYKASLIELRAKLQEEEMAKEALRIQWELAQAELSRPWWKKLFGVK
jgi:hypothetical protein